MIRTPGPQLHHGSSPGFALPHSIPGPPQLPTCLLQSYKLSQLSYKLSQLSCSQGRDCGIEVLNSQVWLSPYSDLDTEKDNNTAAISLSVLFIAGVAIVLVIIYYKRRMSVMRKDIQNRSVYYSDRDPVDGDRTFDLIVRDTERNLHSHSTNTTAASLERNTSTCSDTRGAEGGDLVLNNVRLNLDSQMYPGAGEAEKPPKNVNLNNVRCDAGPSQARRYIKERANQTLTKPNCILFNI